MGKIEKSIAGAPFPTSVALVTTAATGRDNIITLAWVGIVCSEPFMLSAAIRPQRHSHSLLEKNPELVFNIPTKDIINESDYCGTVSGREVDKFNSTGLTRLPSRLVSPPLIAECPVNLEARVKERLSLGTHDLFICEVLASHVDEGLINESGRVDFSLIEPFVYLATDYWDLDKKIGYYAFTKKG